MGVINKFQIRVRPIRSRTQACAARIARTACNAVKNDIRVVLSAKGRIYGLGDLKK